MKLPEHYHIEDIKADDADNTLHVTVSAIDIPDGVFLTELQATYLPAEGYSAGKWEDRESYQLTDLKATLSLWISNHPMPCQEECAGQEEQQSCDEQISIVEPSLVSQTPSDHKHRKDLKHKPGH